MTRRLALAAFAALLLAACSSDSAEQISVADNDISVADEATSVTDTVVEPVTPQSVTASTVHASSTDDFPDILAAQATPEGDGAWRFDVTVSSPYDTPERYADAWRVVGEDGTEFGVRVLTHDHASEQPFTRSQTGIVIPDDVTTVIVEGRDQANGWGGGTLTVDLTADASQ